MSEDKELKKEMLQKNLDNSTREVEMVKSAREEQTKKKEMFNDFLATRKAMHERAMEAYEYVNPTYAFQKDPEYVKHQKHLSDLEFQLDAMNRSMQLLQIDAALKSYEDQLQSLLDNIEELKKQLAELGE